MKQLLPNGFLILFLVGVILFWGCKQRSLSEKTINLSEKAENNWERRAKEEFDMLKNPVTGKIPDGIRRAELLEAATIPLKEEVSLMGGNAYSFQGPNNLGGRCRAVAYDVRFNGAGNRVVLAGGVSGGMFRSTDAGANWTRVSSLNSIHSVTAVAQDPRPGFQDTWYFGTGETWVILQAEAELLFILDMGFSNRLTMALPGHSWRQPLPVHNLVLIAVLI